MKGLNILDKQSLFRSVEGLYAYETGCTDSGIKDEALRNRVFNEIEGMGEDEFRFIFTEFIRIYFVSEEAVKKGYGIEDVAYFIKWLSRNGIDL